MVTAAMKLRHLILGRKAMTNLNSILNSRDMTLPTKVCMVKDRVFPVVMYRYKKWIIKKAAKTLQSCLTLCNPMDFSLLGSPVHGILQARIPEWVAISFYRGTFRPKDQTHVSYVSCIGRWVLYHEHHLGSLSEC